MASAAAVDDDEAVLSDVDDDSADDPAPVLLPAAGASASLGSGAAGAAAEHRIRELAVELDNERRARAEADARLGRLKAFAQDVIRKRDEFSRAAEEASKGRNEALAELAAARRLVDEATTQRDALQADAAAAAQMLTSGMEKIAGKIAAFKTFEAGGLPKSQKYSGQAGVAFGVIKRANEIVEELLRQVDAAAGARDDARQQVEQRNYEIAIEVSQLEATIANLRSESESLAKALADREAKLAEIDAKFIDVEAEAAGLRQAVEESNSKVRSLEDKLESQKPVITEQLGCVSKLYEKLHEILNIVDSEEYGIVDSVFIWKEGDHDENFRVSLAGLKALYELATVATEKVYLRTLEKNEEVMSLNERISKLSGEKLQIGLLLKNALSTNENGVLPVLQARKQAGVGSKLDELGNVSPRVSQDDDVYSMVGVLENTVKDSHLKIIELQHVEEALRAESGHLRAKLEAQAKDIGHLKRQLKEKEEKERLANENVEALMADVAAAEEEIARWKVAAEQEAAAGRAVEDKFNIQLKALHKDFEEATQRILELESKLKFKEETAAAAMAAREAAEKSLRLADDRSTRLRERNEELTRQLEESDRRDNPAGHSHRYICWPWNWLGLNFMQYPQPVVRQNRTEMELSEPLV